MAEDQKTTGQGNIPVVPVESRGFNKGMIINLVLFIGLIALYAIHFFGQPDEKALDDEKRQEALVERKIDDAVNTIAYVDSDLLMDDYMLAIKLQADFEAEQRRLENDLERRQRNFQMEVERFQQAIQEGLISIEQAQVQEQELMQKQQDLMQLNETYRDRLSRKEFEMNNELLDQISDFLARYNLDKGYDFILGYAKGGGILYAREAHDITREVLEQLNKEYEEAN